LDKIKQFLPKNIEVIAQGKYVAQSLKNYLARHPEIAMKCTLGGTVNYFTTESPEKFSQQASLFLRETVFAEKAIVD
jgi:glutamate racemase